MRYFIGLMSGTSLDGVDGVLLAASEVESLSASGAPRLQAMHHVYRAFPDALRRELLALNSAGDNELHRAALAGNQIARAYADTVADLLSVASLAPEDITAAGAHGQTVRHRPGEFDGTGYTLQLLNGALLAELCGVDVVCDFRSRDVAAGGQGAPLVPAFHAALFARPGESVAVLNIGGIANLTLLPAQGPVSGFDCGPGNVLMDAWCALHTGQAYDHQGRWAAGGQVLPDLLRRLLDTPFLQLAPPKSTGRDLFHIGWLNELLAAACADQGAQDVQATLTEFTARAAVEALTKHLPDAQTLLVCGGGAFNLELMRRLMATAPGLNVRTTDAAGLPAMQVEAAAFAWLARATTYRQYGSLPAVTGARGARVLGALYPAAAKNSPGQTP